MEEGLEGTKLGRYRVGRLLGSGGMGAVYAGVQEPLGRPVAIKVLRAEISTSADIAARFKREAELAASLSHPNIAQVTDFGVEDGRAFLVMDLLEGRSLGDLLEREGRLPEARAQRIAMQVLTALAVAHERGIVHRDLKPENVFVQKAGDMGLVKLLDFGIARLVDVDHSMTNTGAVLGTPAYMSPEQARGKKVDARSDVFSFGAVLYEMLSGRRPFAATNYHELMFAVVEEQPTRLAEVDPEISPALAAIVERAMSKAPDARFSSAKEMADAMGALTGLRDGARAPVTTPVARHDSSAQALAPTMASDPNATRPIPPRRPMALFIALPIVALLGVGARATLHDPPPVSPPPSVSVSPPPPPSLSPSPSPSPSPPPSPSLSLSPSSSPPHPDPLPRAGEGEEPPLPPTPPPAPHPSHAAPPRDVVAHCGASGTEEVELPYVGPRDRVSITSAQAFEGMPRGSISAYRSAADDQASDALTACYRGHPILQGQDFSLFVSAEGAVERVEPRVYCPIPPAIASCARRALGEVVFAEHPPNPFSMQVSISIPR